MIKTSSAFGAIGAFGASTIFAMPRTVHAAQFPNRVLPPTHEHVLQEVPSSRDFWEPFTPSNLIPGETLLAGGYSYTRNPDGSKNFIESKDEAIKVISGLLNKLGGVELGEDSEIYENATARVGYPEFANEFAGPPSVYSFPNGNSIVLEETPNGAISLFSFLDGKGIVVFTPKGRGCPTDIDLGPWLRDTSELKLTP
ncbi:MAG TPA: hypothetical protein V6C96_02430 [Vampirovibrionales bacterium]